MTAAMLREVALPVHPPHPMGVADIPLSNGNGMKLWDGNSDGDRIAAGIAIAEGWG